MPPLLWCPVLSWPSCLLCVIELSMFTSTSTLTRCRKQLVTCNRPLCRDPSLRPSQVLVNKTCKVRQLLLRVSSNNHPSSKLSSTRLLHSGDHLLLRVMILPTKVDLSGLSQLPSETHSVFDKYDETLLFDLDSLVSRIVGHWLFFDGNLLTNEARVIFNLNLQNKTIAIKWEYKGRHDKMSIVNKT